MADTAGAPPGAPPGHHDGHRRRARQALIVPATSGGVKLVSARGRVTGWSLHDEGSNGSVPAQAAVLDGYNGGAGTLLAIPANTAWYGTISLTASLKVTAAGAATTQGANVSTAAGLVPSAAVLAQVTLTAGAVGAAATNPDHDRATSVWGPGWIINPTAGALNVTTGTAATTVDAWATGTTVPFPAGATGPVVELYDGGSANGKLLHVISMRQGDDDQEAFGDDGVDFSAGLFVNVVSGTVRGVIHAVLDG